MTPNQVAESFPTLLVLWACRACGHRFIARAIDAAQGSCPACRTVVTRFGPNVRSACRTADAARLADNAAK